MGKTLFPLFISICLQYAVPSSRGAGPHAWSRFIISFPPVHAPPPPEEPFVGFFLLHVGNCVVLVITWNLYPNYFGFISSQVFPYGSKTISSSSLFPVLNSRSQESLELKTHRSPWLVVWMKGHAVSSPRGHSVRTGEGQEGAQEKPTHEEAWEVYLLDCT